MYAMRDEKKTCKQISYDDGVWCCAPDVMQHQSIYTQRAQCFSIHNFGLLHAAIYTYLITHKYSIECLPFNTGSDAGSRSLSFIKFGIAGSIYNT